MNKDQFLGLLRELLTALGAALVTWGLAHDGIWQEISGGILTAAAIGWAVIHNEGREMIYTLVRKALSSLAGILVAGGILTPEKAEVVLGLATSLAALAWSLGAKGGNFPPAGGATPLFIAGCCLFLGSCSGVMGDYDVRGEAVFLAEDGAKAGLRWEPGKPVAAFARVAVRDPQTGKVTSYSYVEIARKAKVVAEK